MIQFCKNYTKVLSTFAHGLTKCSESLDKDMLLNNKGFDTTTIAISGFKKGLDDLSKLVQDKINIVFGDLVEPMDLYYKHYQQSAYDTIR